MTSLRSRVDHDKFKKQTGLTMPVLRVRKNSDRHELSASCCHKGQQSVKSYGEGGSLALGGPVRS